MTKGRKNYKKKPVKSDGLSAKETKQVKSLINKESENKYWDVLYDYAGQYYNTGLTIPFLISGVTQGQSVDNRIGDLITPRKVMLNLTVYFDGTSVDTTDSDSYRIIIFQSKVPSNLLTPADSDILQYPSIALALGRGIISPYHYPNVIQGKKFKILYDKSFGLNAGSDAREHRIVIKKNMSKISFEPAVVHGTNHIWGVVVNNDGAGASLTMAYVSRFIYDDF